MRFFSSLTIAFIDFLKKLFLKNSKIFFVLAEKILRIIYSLVLGVLVYRTLGVEDSGRFSVLMSYFAILQFFSSGGLNELNILNLSNNYNKNYGYIQITYMVQLFYSILISIIFILLLKSTYDISLLFILGIATIVRFNNVNKSILEKDERWDVIFKKELIIFSFLIFLRGLGVYFNWGLDFFLVTVFVESLSYLLIYGVNKLRFNFVCSFYSSELFKLVKNSFPILLQGLTIIVIMKADTIFASFRLDSYEIGIYSIGIKLSEALYFLPLAISSFLLPKISKCSELELKNMIHRFNKKYLIYIYIIVATIFLFSDSIILLLFGDDFLDSSFILKTHVLTLIFVFLGVMGDKYYMKLGLNNIIFYKTFLSGVIYFLFLGFFVDSPKILVFSVLIFQVSNSLLTDLLFKEGRILFVIKVKSLLTI